jgi:hypothetical protein
MVGPTQAGKSLIFNHITDLMSVDTNNRADGLIPFVCMQIETVEEGRVKGKWLDIMILKQLRHPVYMHAGNLDELDHYFPSKGRDESSLRLAMNSALAARETRLIALDEAHLLTRSRRSEFRGHILESLKSVAAIDRTLLLCGGYELAYTGLFDHPHFAGRTITYDIGRYTTAPEHVAEWKRILARFSQYLTLEPRSLLMDLADAFLLAANGTIGLLEKWLWMCKQIADAKGGPITADLVRKCAPPVLEQQRIAEDIRRGVEALRNVPNVKNERKDAAIDKGGATESSAVPIKAKDKRRAFESSPRRIIIKGIEVYEGV